MGKQAQEGKPKPRAGKNKTTTHPTVKWLRTAGIGAELFGWGGLMLAGWFWTGAGFIYAGFIVLAVDAWLEPDLRGYIKSKALITLIVFGFAVAFSWGIVFVGAPLDLSAFMLNAEYPAGTAIAGIDWKPQFTEVQLWVSNPTDRGYEDINLVIRPSVAIAKIAQATNVPNVSFEDKNAQTLRMMDIDLGTGKSTAIPLVLLATDAGYRMRCPYLAPKTEIRIEIALADIKWNPSPELSQLPKPQQMLDPNYVLRDKFDDFSTYWFGHPYGDVYAPRPTSSDWMKIEGEYVAVERKRTISKKLEIGGLSVKPQRQ